MAQPQHPSKPQPQQPKQESAAGLSIKAQAGEATAQITQAIFESLEKRFADKPIILAMIRLVQALAIRQVAAELLDETEVTGG